MEPEQSFETHAPIAESSCTVSIYGSLELISWADDEKEIVRVVFQPSAKLAGKSCWLHWSVVNMARGPQVQGMQQCLKEQDPEFCFSVQPNDDYFLNVSVFDEPTPCVLDKPGASFHVYLKHSESLSFKNTLVDESSMTLDDDFSHDTKTYWTGRQGLTSDSDDESYPYRSVAKLIEDNGKGKEEL